jgi:hypothetical protein
MCHLFLMYLIFLEHSAFRVFFQRFLELIRNDTFRKVVAFSSNFDIIGRNRFQILIKLNILDSTFILFLWSELRQILQIMSWATVNFYIFHILFTYLCLWHCLSQQIKILNQKKKCTRSSGLRLRIDL